MSAAISNEIKAVVRGLLIGAQVTGVRFGTLQLLLSSPRISGEIYIVLMSAFQVFPSMPLTFPETEAEVPEASEEEDMLSLFALRYLEVEEADLLDNGHLVVSFAGGAVLYVNGSNPGPEPWYVGLNASDSGKSVQVIAISGSQPIVIPASER